VTEGSGDFANGGCLRFLFLLTTCTVLQGELLSAQTLLPAVSGLVADSAGRPLASAIVWVPETDYSALTDAQGWFRFDSLPASTVTLRAVFIGYRSHQIDSVRTSPGQTTPVNFHLQASHLLPGCTMTPSGTTQ
jgi:Carboxypeptidase regulatory-like domain